MISGFPSPLRFATLAAPLLLACAAEVAEPPHASLQQLRRAVEAGDTAGTLQYIDPEAVIARLVRDVLAAGRDSLKLSADDTLTTKLRAAVDSVQREWVALLRTQLGLSIAASTKHDRMPQTSEGADEAESDLYPSEEIFAEAVEIVGDGRARYVGDTAFVDRVLRYGYHDTTATLRLALVPVERAHWRIVAFHNGVPLAVALRKRQAAILERANKPLRDSISTRISIRDLLVSREPLAVWERYAVEVRATVQNHGTEPLVLYSAQLVGPHLSLEDTVAQLLRDPVTIGPGSSSNIVWRHDLHADNAALFDLVGRSTLYRVEVTDVEWGSRRSSRVQLYRTWRDFLRRNPLPTPTSGGVLSHASVR